MAEPFLILHKVRGEPAFDIAERNDDMGTPSDPGPWWIIPTSGHRAYPLLQWEFNQVVARVRVSGEDYEFCYTPIQDYTKRIDDNALASAPDHYSATTTRSRLATAASDILSLMGIGKPKPQAPVKRRTIP